MVYNLENEHFNITELVELYTNGIQNYILDR